MERPKEPTIDFPIERINKFLDNHIFEIPFIDESGKIKLPVKVKLTGMRNFISTGDWVPYVTFDYHIISGNQIQNFMTSLFFNEYNNKEGGFKVNVTNGGHRRTELITSNLSEMLRNFLKYWNVDYRVSCVNVFNDVPYTDVPKD